MLYSVLCLPWEAAREKAKETLFLGILGSERKRNERPRLSQFSYKVGALNELLSEKDKTFSASPHEGMHAVACKDSQSTVYNASDQASR